MWEEYKSIIPHIAVGSGVVDQVAGWAVSNEYRTILVVCDPNTRQVAGERVIELLRAEGLTVSECCYTEQEPAPDEHSIGVLTAAFTPDIDLIIGVGSGTINDICTFVGARVDRPTAIVGTAASMDGYASLGSAMLIDGVKVTPPTRCACAIFCDIDLMTAAPMLLTAAGLGDMLGKFTALADWQLANLLVGESKPDHIASMVEEALAKIVKGAPKLADRDPAVIQSVTEGLILSGVAISLYGDSRPASGTEHHLAHFWEMRMLAEGKKPALHGLKVGVATIVGLIMWRELSVSLVDRISELNRQKNIKPLTYADERYASDIQRLYGRTAVTIMQTDNPNLPAPFIEANQQAILDIANSLPSPEEIAAMLLAVGAPVRPSEIDLTNEVLRESIIYSRDRKKTYTILQLLGDLCCLEDFAGRVGRYFADTALTGVRCFVLDMDGTIYLGGNVFPFTERFLEFLKDAGIDYVFYTNNSSSNAAKYIDKLQRMGISATPDKLLMSTHVLLEFLKNNPPACKKVSGSPGKRVFVAGTKALRDDFADAGYTLEDEDPDFVVLGFDTDMDYERLTKLCDFIRSGLPYFGVHIDYNCPVESGFIPDCGSLAAAVTASTGITPEFFGKPSRHTLDFVINKTGYREDEICFVGDRLYTDIAITSGTRARSVLVLSGETSREDLAVSAFLPDLVVKDLTELQDYLA